MKLRLLLPLAGLLMTACWVEILADLEVNWDINGSTSSNLCSTYNVDKWRVVLDGREYGLGMITEEFSCGTWDGGARFHLVTEGTYDTSMEALPPGGGSPVATLAKSGVFVDGAVVMNRLTFHFTDSDFQAPAGDTLKVYWTINGTEDGSSTGKSFDKCNEVSATSAEVEVDGVAKFYDCDASSAMMASIAMTKDPSSSSIRVRLVDSAKKALTTWSSTGPGVAVSGKIFEWRGDFDHQSFFDGKIKGTYHFETTFEGKTCGDTTPAVGHSVTLLKLTDGTAVTADWCGPDSMCNKTDGASFGSCYAKGQVQKIKDVDWGEYKLKISGTPGGSTGYEVCWEKEYLVLFGAGASNPVQKHDLPRTSSTGDCS